MADDDCECRPLGFLIGLPFALLALVLSLVGAVIWILGYATISFKFDRSSKIQLISHNVLVFFEFLILNVNCEFCCRSVLSCLCPCCICCAGLANLAVGLVKLPIRIVRWFTHQIPC